MTVTVGPTVSPKVVLIGIALAFILVALIADRGHTWLEQRKAVQAATQPLIATAAATAGIEQDGADADAKRGQVEAVVDSARDDFNQSIDKGNRHDPATRSRSDRAVPGSVRNAFKARRIAIERSRCAGEECRAPAAEPDAAER